MKTLFLILSIAFLASCRKPHVATQLYVITTNVKHITFESENNIFSLTASDDTTFYFMSETNQEVTYYCEPINSAQSFKFDVFQSVDGADTEILHVNSKNKGTFKTED